LTTVFITRLLYDSIAFLTIDIRSVLKFVFSKHIRDLCANID
jgi:hypothetical protein